MSYFFLVITVYANLREGVRGAPIYTPRVLKMAFIALDEQDLDVPEQRTPAWFALRKNRLTGSRLSEFNFINSEERLRRYYNIIYNNAPKDPFTEEQKGWMKYGVEHEPVATDSFIKSFPEYVIMECPFSNCANIPEAIS